MLVGLPNTESDSTRGLSPSELRFALCPLRIFCVLCGEALVLLCALLEPFAHFAIGYCSDLYQGAEEITEVCFATGVFAEKNCP